jgi:hypothetical protein
MVGLDRLQSWRRFATISTSFHAVAQHYGLPTTLLDFTFDPEVAGFFASHGARAAPLPGALRFSCIICANLERLTRSWEDINQRHREGTGLVRMVTVDVRNLWRLQAQKGLFLYIHVDANLLEMFSLFLHIEFPWKADRKLILPNTLTRHQSNWDPNTFASTRCCRSNRKSSRGRRSTKPYARSVSSTTMSSTGTG